MHTGQALRSSVTQEGSAHEEAAVPYYQAVGDIPRKRHTQFRRPDGGLYSEELMGQEGFSSESSLLYHRHPPTAVRSIDAIPDPAVRRRCASCGGRGGGGCRG